jgi:tocopherol O-methyltransferase
MGEAIAGEPLRPFAQKGGKDIGDEYSIPATEPFVSFSALKDRIRHHYEVCSDYYYSLWGEHIHHGYFIHPSDTKEVAQTRLISLLLEKSALPTSITVLDVGCGIGGTSRYLAREKGCGVTGVTISRRQVEIATKSSAEEASLWSQEAEILTNGSDGASSNGLIKLGKLGGSVKFIELDAEKMGEYFLNKKFDCVWISEAMSHLPNKALFFKNAATLLNPGGKLVVADWFKSEECSEAEMEADIKPIEGYSIISGPCELFN